MSGKNIEIERLRGVAIVMVALSHMEFLSGHVHPIVLAGWTGVDLFFVISGFVVARSLVGSFPRFSEHQDLAERLTEAGQAIRDFFLRRFLRIAPSSVLWAVLGLVLCIFVYGAPDGARVSFNAAGRELISILTFQYNFSYIYGDVDRLLPYFWSLSVEEHFYLLLPLFLIVFATKARRLGAALALIALIALVVRPLVPFTGRPELLWSWYRMASQNRFDSLLLGVCLSFLPRGQSAASRLIPNWLGNIASLYLVGMLLAVPSVYGNAVLDKGNGFSLLVYAGCSFGLVYLASFEVGLVLNFAGIKRALEYLGARSYALYLIHVPAIRLAEYLSPHWMDFSHSWLISAGVAAALAVLLAECNFRWLEQPLIRWGATLTQRSREGAGTENAHDFRRSA